MAELLVIAFLGGFITGISPCIVPVLPVVMAGGSTGNSWKRPLLIVAGLVISFSLTELLGSTVLSALHLPQNLLRHMKPRSSWQLQAYPAKQPASVHRDLRCLSAWHILSDSIQNAVGHWAFENTLSGWKVNSKTKMFLIQCSRSMGRLALTPSRHFNHLDGPTSEHHPEDAASADTSNAFGHRERPCDPLQTLARRWSATAWSSNFI